MDLLVKLLEAFILGCGFATGWLLIHGILGIMKRQA